MQTTVLLPQLELTMESVQVAGWLVKAGDSVAAGQPIIEIETQKSVVEVPCPVAGTVRRLCVAKGDTIGEKAPLCIVTSGADEPLDDAAPSAPAGAPTTAPGSASSQASAPSEPGGGIRAAPAARKLAADLGIDISTIKGTGPGGRISLDDVKNATR
jgi:pyruvate/2-oxoglutarate dehydrogenase complex dihydrolipoamide acyltransferase (E2) component